MSSPSVSVVIPSWNGWKLLEAHLPSVIRAAGSAGSHEVVVCDDGSDDGTPSLAAERFPSVRMVRRAANAGFAVAANEGVGACSGRIVVLLNNDMEIERDAVAGLVAAVEADPAVFAAVPSIVRAGTGEEESRTRLGFRRGVVSTSIAGSDGQAPAYACGGAMAFRREDFARLGGFDPLFAPFYWEDVDLSYRARKRGRTIVHVPAARVVHDHGATIGTRFPRRDVSRIYERNRLVFTWKNLTDPALRRRHFSFLPVKCAWDLIAHPAFLRGLRDALALRERIRRLRDAERAAATRTDRELLGA